MTAKPNMTAQTTLHLKRTFAAPREKVFRAWTDPEALKRWWGPGECSTSIAEVDLRVGGKYRLGMQCQGDGGIFFLNGVYREILPPERLVYTWRWESPDMDAGETLVTVEFHDHGQTTEIVLIHENFPRPEISEQHHQGWLGCFDSLAEMLERGDNGQTTIS